jgi:hypothetical protein
MERYQERYLCRDKCSSPFRRKLPPAMLPNSSLQSNKIPPHSIICSHLLCKPPDPWAALLPLPSFAGLHLLSSTLLRSQVRLTANNAVPPNKIQRIPRIPPKRSIYPALPFAQSCESCPHSHRAYWQQCRASSECPSRSPCPDPDPPILPGHGRDTRLMRSGCC